MGFIVSVLDLVSISCASVDIRFSILATAYREIWQTQNNHDALLRTVASAVLFVPAKDLRCTQGAVLRCDHRTYAPYAILTDILALMNRPVPSASQLADFLDTLNVSLPLSPFHYLSLKPAA